IEDDDIKGICFLYPSTSSSSKGTFGSVCEYSSDCKSNICVSNGDSGMCSQICNVGEIGSCPNGYKCFEATDGNSYCFPGDNLSDLCKPCESSKDCSSELCLTDGNLSICSRYCVVSSSNCPSGYYCTEIESGGGGCWPEKDECNIQNAPKELGETCYTLDECKSGLICVAAKAGDDYGKCYYECDPKSPKCPSDDKCVTLTNESGACMPRSGTIDAGITDISSIKDTGTSPSKDTDQSSTSDVDLIEELNNLAGCECNVLF
ncbi:MAG: hypothetical protein ACPL7I_10695, partial [Myxococcota bacterium]